jgi:hypothetical protein
MYPQKDILQILNDSGFHSEEWEMTDEEYEGTIYKLYLYYFVYN